MSKLIFKYILVQLLVGMFAAFSIAQGLPTAKPEKVGMSSVKLNRIDGIVENAISKKKMPGTVVLVGRKGKIVFRKAYGNRSLVPRVEPMTVDTIFDLASLTKPIATATSIMILVEQGRLRLSDTIGKFIPDIDDNRAKKITIKQLLTHTSGYRPDFNLGEKWSGRDGMLKALKKERLKTQPGMKFVYSDIGFIVLGEIVERVTGETLDVFVKRNQLSSLKFSTFIRRDSNRKTPNSLANYSWMERTAPTEDICGQQSYLGSKPDQACKKLQTILRAAVHDPTSYRMNGVAGHAGLFSTADDLARYCQMLLKGGILDGKRILSPSTVAKMTKPYVVSAKGESRGLGWDINTKFSSNRGELFPLGSYGHTGFTGTGIWIDPLSETFVIFLSNRVHPDGKGSIVDVRARISTVAASAIEDITPKQIRDFEAKYYADIASQIPGSRFRVANIKRKHNVREKGTSNAIVFNGIDVLENEKFRSLNNLKIGLVTNHTGVNRAGKTTIDVLNEAKNVKLISLFSPEHGIRGKLDQTNIDDSIDEQTGLPIYSLYGKSRRPKPKQLKNLDALVFDIQDIGTRFYTYISTLRFILEEAAKAHVKVFVLDRPNPINGVDVDGAVADADKLSFVATHTLPIRHGMTIGEIALMMNSERNINADLKIIKMQNWKRSMWFDETNQTWINPSPNMRNLTQATLYPGIGLLETTNLSVGRGTDTPFEVIGAPWLDGQKLAHVLNEKKLSGVRFVPVRFTPKASVFRGKNCNGINIIVVNRKTFKPIKTGLITAIELRKHFPQKWNFKNYNRLLANSKTYSQVLDGEKFLEIQSTWRKSLRHFLIRRKKHLIYE